MNTSALEKHYRVRELAALWGFSDNTIIRLFAAEQGVIRLESGAGRRKYTTLSIPEGVALRVHERLSQENIDAELATGNPLRIIRLRDLDAGVVKKSRNILKLKSEHKLPNREGLPETIRGRESGMPHREPRDTSCVR
jgi:hypothetical protein